MHSSTGCCSHISFECRKTFCPVPSSAHSHIASSVLSSIFDSGVESEGFTPDRSKILPDLT